MSPVDLLRSMIEAQKQESEFQNFLESNREFIPLSFLHHHGVHFNMVFTKYPVQESYETDFMYLTKTSGSWRAVLVEIEKPSSKIFKKGSNEFHSDFISSKDQILNWKTKLSSPGAHETFKNNLSSLLQHMIGNEIDFRYILIHGRRSEYEGSPERKRKIETDLGKDVQFLSFDSLLDLNNKEGPAFLSKKVQERVHIIDYGTNPFAGDTLSGWLEPHHLFVTENVKSKLLQYIADKQIPSTGSAFPDLYEKNASKKKMFVEALVVRNR